MRYLHFQLQVKADEVIQVVLQQSAYLRLMDDDNYASYRRGDQYRYHGGMASGSPAVIKPPTGGSWHLAIDLGGEDGEVKATVNIVNEVSPEMRKPRKKGLFG